MKIALNPAQNFKSSTNLLEQKTGEQKESQTIVLSDKAREMLNTPQYPSSWSVDEDNRKVREKFDMTKIDVIQKEILKKQGMSFEETLKDKDWEKTYHPEGDFVHIHQKGVYDGKEFELASNGQVTQVSCWSRPKVIIEENKDTKELFKKIKNGKESGDIKENYTNDTSQTKPKKSLWFKTKEAIANVWKFFSVAGTMAYATAKGLWQGAIAAGAVFGTALVLKGAKAIIKNEKTFSEIIKTPFKTSGKVGNILAISAGIIMLGINLVKGKLQANQNSAVIEHKMDVAHVND